MQGVDCTREGQAEKPSALVRHPEVSHNQDRLEGQREEEGIPES